MVLRRRRYTPLIPLLFLGISLIWLGSNGGENPPPQESLLASKIEEGQVKGPPGVLRSGRFCTAAVSLLAGHHGSMAPKTNSGHPGNRAQAKAKGKGDQQPQQSRVEFGLPASVVQAVQSISTRSAQDLWSPTPSVFGEYTAEQSFQRRSNATNRLAKKEAGRQCQGQGLLFWDIIHWDSCPGSVRSNSDWTRTPRRQPEK